MDSSFPIRQLLELVPEAVFLKDEDGRYRYANEAAAEFLGLSVEEILGRTDRDLFPEDAALMIGHLHERVLASGEPRRLSYPLTMPSGETRHWEVSWLPVSDDDVGFRGVGGIARDVTERHRAERALARAKKKYAAVFDVSPVSLMVVDLSTGQIREVNRAWEELYGYRSEEAEGEQVEDFERAIFLDPGVPDELRRSIAEEGEVHDLLAQVRRQDGRVRDVLLSGVPVIVEEEVLLVGSAQDVSPLRETERDLRRRALHDALTGLPNRDLLRDRCEQALHRSDRRREPFALLYLDLDGFKSVNDTLGHAAGDDLLVELADRLAARVRDGDTVARVGGDEFVLLLESVNGEDGARMAAERALEALREPFSLPNGEVAMRASAGAVWLPPEVPRHDSAEELGKVVDALVDEADRAMYAAKERGGGGLELRRVSTDALAAAISAPTSQR